MASDVDLSIIIVNWNTKELLRNCLKSVYAETDGMTFEVFVVDNGSTDASAEMVERQFPHATLLRNRDNVGFAKASNQAMRLGRGRHTLLLNSDMVLQGQALRRMVEFMEQYPEAGVVGCHLTNQEGILELSCRSFPTPSVAVFLNYPLGRILPPERTFRGYLLSDWDHASIREVDWVTGACLLARRESIKDVGLLDEDYFMFAEDLDWCYRMKLSKWKVFYLPSATGVHVKGASYRNETGSAPMRLEAHRSMMRFFNKHCRRRATLLFRAFGLVAAVLQMLKVVARCGVDLRCGPQARREAADQWAMARLFLSAQA